MVKEWLPEFRAEPRVKAARWVVQSVMETPAGADAPLWEPGISTDEYEERLDRANLSWAVRATAGRSKGTILARFVADEDQPETFEVECMQTAFPEALFDTEKLDQFLKDQGTAGTAGLFTALLTSHGFEIAGEQ